MIFGEKGINKNLFHKHKHLIGIDKLDIDRIVKSNKDSYGTTSGYITSEGIKSLCIKIPQVNGYVKYFDGNNKYMNLLVYDKKLLDKYNEYGIRLVIS